MGIVSMQSDVGQGSSQDGPGPHPYHFFPFDPQRTLRDIGKESALTALQQMLSIRHLEQRGEAAYQQGKVGGFFHSYAGQEAIQVGCIAACGSKHWFTTTYRCHALAFLLGATPNAIMAELYGKATGCARGRGGSMHLYAERLLGGLAIVGGHIPIATGAAFSIQYLKQRDIASFCFLGDGATVQGAFHESLNLASLWNLPCLYVIENNRWGMGTAVERAVAVQPIAEHFAKAYGMTSYTLDGTDFLHCYAGFRDALSRVLHTSRPVLIEAIAERFRGHSISDPGFYRTKEELQQALQKDPIPRLKNSLIEAKFLTEEQFAAMDREAKKIAVAAMQFAEESPWPDPMDLEKGVFYTERG
jgi:pyruvate dehydrogenase E1 component alpha subunit